MLAGAEKHESRKKRKKKTLHEGMTDTLRLDAESSGNTQDESAGACLVAASLSSEVCCAKDRRKKARLISGR